MQNFLFQKCAKEEESKKYYKQQLQCVKNEYIILTQRMETLENALQDREATIWDQQKSVDKIQTELQIIVDNQLKDISKLECREQILLEEIKVEKQNAATNYEKYKEQLLKTTELRLRNELLEKRITDHNSVTEKLKTDFQHERSYHRSRDLKRQKQCLKECRSSSGSPSSDILQETKQRLQKLEDASRLVDEKFKKINTPMQSFSGLFQKIQNENHSFNPSSDSMSEITIETKMEPKKVNEKVEKKIYPVLEIQTDLAPALKEVGSKIKASCQDFENTVIEASRNLEKFVKESEKLVESTITRSHSGTGSMQLIMTPAFDLMEQMSMENSGILVSKIYKNFMALNSAQILVRQAIRLLGNIQIIDLKMPWHNYKWQKYCPILIISVCSLYQTWTGHVRLEHRDISR